MGARGGDSEIPEPSPHRIRLATVEAPQIAFQDPAISYQVRQKDEAELRPAPRAEESVGQGKVHRFMDRTGPTGPDSPTRGRTATHPPAPGRDAS